MQVVGSSSSRTGSWLWSWHNSSILPICYARLQQVIDFGRRHHFSQLTAPELQGDEYTGWEMTSCAARILQARGAYRCPGERGFLYLVLFEHTFPNQPLDDFRIDVSA